MFKDLNSYEKIYIGTPLLTLILILVIFAKRFVPEIPYFTFILTIFANVLFFVVATGYGYAFFAKYRYTKILKSPALKSVETSWRERRLYDFCILSALISFFTLIALSFG